MRGKDHLGDLYGMQNVSRMSEYQRTKHAGLVTDFRMDVVGVYSEDAMLWQIAEAVRINNAPESQLMNNKEE